MTASTATRVNVTDIVRRLTGGLHKMTAETVLIDTLPGNRSDIRHAIDEAIDDGYIKIVQVRDTTYGKGIRFIALADGIAYCRTCILGCTHEATRDGDSCGHAGCWGPDATNDCPGVGYARANLAAYDHID